MTRPSDRDHREHVAGQLTEQAQACAAMGSPLYGRLLDAAADDCRSGGPVWRVLSHHVLPGRGDAVALRFMAAVHRLVLTRRAPELALHYPSAGGQAGDCGQAISDPVWQAFVATVEEHAAELVDLTSLPCQTNEVGRCAPLAWAFLMIAERTGLPLRCLEVGASSGLNLRWDHFHYGGAGAVWGPPDSLVDLSGMWSNVPPALPARVRVTERRGCDTSPIDPTSSDGRLAVTASVWADMTERLERLRGALQLARIVPATVDQEALDTWTVRQLEEHGRGVATVVFHSVVAEYVPEAAWARFTDALAVAGARSTAEAPLAWVRLEPISALRRHGLTMTTWPGGEEQVLGVSGPHGQDVAKLDRGQAESAAALSREAKRVRGTDGAERGGSSSLEAMDP